MWTYIREHICHFSWPMQVCYWCFQIRFSSPSIDKNKCNYYIKLLYSPHFIYTFIKSQQIPHQKEQEQNIINSFRPISVSCAPSASLPRKIMNSFSRVSLLSTLSAFSSHLPIHNVSSVLISHSLNAAIWWKLAVHQQSKGAIKHPMV